MTPVVDVDEVQGNVLYPYPGITNGRYLRCRIEPGRVEEAVALIGTLTERELTFGRSTAENPTPRAYVNLAFTYQGLMALEVPDSVLEEFPGEFRDGARERAALLGDTWPADQASADEPFEDAHLLLSVMASSESDCDDAVARLRELNDKAGDPLRVVEEQWATLVTRERRIHRDRPEDRPEREHFGFADGRSQPAIAGVDEDPVGDGIYAMTTPRGRVAQALVGLGMRQPPRRWRLSRTGEFLLGYENEDGETPEGPRAPLGPNGTFMVYRKMAQDVEGFSKFIAENAEELGMDPGELRARILGRWSDGTPLASSPVEDPLVSNNRRRSNEFLYADDPNGLACPLGAHVRRANPRDGMAGGAERTMRHRIIRRGMPYGEGAHEERGLIFVCFNASLRNGFEFIQRHWIADGRALGLGEGPDFLLAPHRAKPARMLIGGQHNAVLEAPSEPFVTVRGCEYLFVPSRRGCEWIGRPQRL